jgi:hypothetical protein
MLEVNGIGKFRAAWNRLTVAAMKSTVTATEKFKGGGELRSNYNEKHVIMNRS